MRRLVVVGVGTAYRRDDGAGLAVARRVREAAPPVTVVVEAEADPMLILERCAGAEAVVIIDAVSSGGRPGTVYRLDAGGTTLPARLFGATSTHALSVGEVVELARALGTLPPRVIVYGIEGRTFEAGEGLSPEVAAAVEDVAARVAAEAAEGGLMHESSLLAGLMRAVEDTARAHGAHRVSAVRVQVGALVQISADHLREHVVEAARGTLAEGCRVEIEVLDDPADARAQQVVLDSVELETDAGEDAGR